MADVLSEFLVGLGFKVDESSFRNFNNAITGVATQIAKMGVAVEAAAAGVIAGVRKMSEALDQVYFAAQRTGATVGGIQALGYAFSQMGLTAGQAQQAVEGMAAALRSTPGLRGLLSSLGVDPNQATEKIVQQFAAKTAHMPAYISQQYAAMFGIDPNMLMVLQRGVAKFTAEYEDMAKRMGVSSKEAAASGNAFMTAWRGLTTVFDLLQQKVTQTLGKSLAGDLERFKHFVLDNSKAIAEVVERFGRIIIYAGELVLRFGARAKQLWDELPAGFQTAIKWLAAFLVAWRAFNLAVMATPLGLVAAGLVALAGAIFLLYDDYKAFAQYGQDHALLPWDTLIPYLKLARDGLVAVWGAIREATPSFEEIKTRVIDFATAFNDLVTAINGAGVSFGDFKSIGMGVVNALLQPFRMMVAAVKEALDILTGTMRIIGDLIRGDFVKAWKDAVDTAWQMIKDFGSPSNAIWAVMPESWKQALLTMGQYFKDEFAKFPGYAVEAFDFLYEVVTKKFTDIRTWLGDKFFGWFKKQWDAIKDLLGASGDTGGYSPTSFGGSPLDSKPAIQLITYTQGVASAVGGAAMPNLPNASTSGAAPRGIRNNNPLNLSVAPGQEGLVGRDAQFGVYGTLQQGIASAAKQLLRYQDAFGLTTIAQIIEKWSPSNAPGNSPAATANYINSVARRMGVGPNTPINLHDPSVMRQLIAAMGRVEVGREIDPTALQQGVPGGGGGVVNALRGAANAMTNFAQLRSLPGSSPLVGARPAGFGSGDGGGKTVNANQTNTINITGVSDPKTAAAETERALDRNTQRMMINFKTVAI